jgi:hypothetical protein
MVVFAHEVETAKGPLTSTEREELDRCEAVIARGLRNFVEVGNALALICEQRLYRQEFPTFEDYCRERWDVSVAYAYRKMQAARVVTGCARAGRSGLSVRIVSDAAPGLPVRVAVTWR